MLSTVLYNYAQSWLSDLSINMYCALIQNAQDGYMTVHNLSQFSIFLIYNFQFFQWGDCTQLCNSHRILHLFFFPLFKHSVLIQAYQHSHKVLPTGLHGFEIIFYTMSLLLPAFTVPSVIHRELNTGIACS